MNRFRPYSQALLTGAPLLSIFLTVQPVMGAPGTCSDIFSRAEMNIRPSKIKRSIHRQKVFDLTGNILTNSKDSRAFQASLQMRYPEALVSYENSYRVVFDQSPYRTLHYRPIHEEGQWRAVVRHMLGWSVLKDPMYKSVYSNYEGRIEDQISSVVQSVENELPGERLWFGVVRVPISSEVVGTVRIANGTANFLDGASPHPELPFERIFHERGLLPKTAQKLAKIRNENPSQPIYEIGKLSLKKSLSGNEHDRALGLMEMMVLERLVLFHPDAVFYAHVASDAHLTLYRRNWRWRVEETVYVPYRDSSTGEQRIAREYILELTAAEFRSALLRRLGLDDSVLQYTPDHF